MKKRPWFHYLWFWLLVAVAVYLVIARFSEFGEIFALFGQIDFRWVVLALILQAVTYLAAAVAYRDILRAQGLRVPLGKLLRMYLALTFWYHVLPAGGLTGTVVISNQLKRLGVPTGIGFLTAMLGMFIGYVGFFVLLLVSMFYFIASGGPRPISYSTVGILLLIVLIVSVIFDRLIVHHHWLHRLMERLSRWPRFKRRNLLNRFDRFMEELIQGRIAFMKGKWKYVLPTLEQTSIFILDALTIYLLFLGLHQPASFMVILIAALLARTFSSISILPGGIGAYEVAQVVILTALGVPLPAATAATLFFRLLSYWLPIPIGLYFFRKLSLVPAAT